jgi:hypothetical protein
VLAASYTSSESQKQRRIALYCTSPVQRFFDTSSCDRRNFCGASIRHSPLGRCSPNTLARMPNMRRQTRSRCRVNVVPIPLSVPAASAGETSLPSASSPADDFDDVRQICAFDIQEDSREADERNSFVHTACRAGSFTAGAYQYAFPHSEAVPRELVVPELLCNFLRSVTPMVGYFCDNFFTHSLGCRQRTDQACHLPVVPRSPTLVVLSRNYLPRLGLSCRTSGRTIRRTLSRRQRYRRGHRISWTM